jgi:hypothetical protein
MAYVNSQGQLVQDTPENAPALYSQSSPTSGTSNATIDPNTGLPRGTLASRYFPSAPAETPLQQAQRELADQMRANSTVPNSTDVRNQIYKDSQGYIDAVGKYYDTLFNEERNKGNQRNDQVRAFNINSGNVGGDFASANAAKQEGLNKEALAAIAAEREAKLTGIYDKLDQRARDEYQLKKQEALGNAQGYVKYLQDTQAESLGKVTDLAKAGLPLLKLKETQLSTGESVYDFIKRTTGKSDIELESLYNQNLPDNMKPKVLEKTIQLPGGNAGLVRTTIDLQNPANTTQQTFDLKLPYSMFNEQNYKTQIAPDGTLLLVPDKFDPNKPAKDQIIVYGQEGQFGADKYQAVKFSSEDAFGNKSESARVFNTRTGKFESPGLGSVTGGGPAGGGAGGGAGTSRVSPSPSGSPPSSRDASFLDTYADTTISGKKYIDLSKLEGKQKAAIRQMAAKNGYSVVNKDQAEALQEVDNAKLNQNAILQAITPHLPVDAQGRILGGALKNKLSKYLQTDDQLAAFGAFRAAAIQSLRAMAGSKGLRINQAEIQLSLENDIPQITDTVSAAQQKMKNVMTLLNNAETSILVSDRSSLLDSGNALLTIDGKSYKAGDTVTNKQGQKGRVNADGTITPL